MNTKTKKLEEMKMRAKEMFEGISTYELISYKLDGDNSKELHIEIARRFHIEAAARVGKTSNVELDARYNG